MMETGNNEIKTQLKNIKTSDDYAKFVGVIYEFSKMMEDLQ